MLIALKAKSQKEKSSANLNFQDYLNNYKFQHMLDAELKIAHLALIYFLV